jgi:hypothetical protein
MLIPDRFERTINWTRGIRGLPGALPDRAYQGNAEGWHKEPAELAGCLHVPA